jgi:hypothetical protein
MQMIRNTTHSHSNAIESLISTAAKERRMNEQEILEQRLKDAINLRESLQVRSSCWLRDNVFREKQSLVRIFGFVA